MLNGVNDKPEHAKQLIKLLDGVRAKMNLIPFNPFPHTPYERSDAETIQRFRGYFNESRAKHDHSPTRGDDIDAVCGQLVGQVKDRTKRQNAI